MMNAQESQPGSDGSSQEVLLHPESTLNDASEGVCLKLQEALAKQEGASRLSDKEEKEQTNIASKVLQEALLALGVPNPELGEITVETSTYSTADGTTPEDDIFVDDLLLMKVNYDNGSPEVRPGHGMKTWLAAQVPHLSSQLNDEERQVNEESRVQVPLLESDEYLKSQSNK